MLNKSGVRERVRKGASTYNGIAVLMCYDVLFRAGEMLLSLNLTGH